MRYILCSIVLGVVTILGWTPSSASVHSKTPLARPSFERSDDGAFNIPNSQRVTGTTIKAIGAPPMTPAVRRSPAYAKLDNALADLAQRVSRTPSSGTQQLRTANPLLRLRAISATPYVLVDAIAAGDARSLQGDLQQLGVIHSSRFSNLVSGWLPVASLSKVSTLASLRALHASMMYLKVGKVTSQGDYAQGSYLLRAPQLTPGLDGSGVKVGILSDSFNCQNGYTQDVASGDLPPNVEILEEDPGCQSGTDEGRAMAQIVYDVAPSSSLAFYTADNGEADFANGILALAGDGAKVIVDDVGYFDEPVFQDGIIGKAIDSAVANSDVSYFSAAGNDARQAWESAYRDSGVAAPSSAPNAGEKLVNFDPTGNSTVTTLPLSILATPNGFVTIFIVHWDQAYATGGGPGSKASFDLCLTSADGTTVYFCSGPSAVGDDPVIVLGVNDNTSQSQPVYDDVGLQLGLVGGTAPNRLKITFADNGGGAYVTNSALATNSGTIQGHPLAEKAAAVGAVPFYLTPACNNTAPVLEPYSSAGGDSILFDAQGNPLNSPVIRQKPEFVAPDGGATTFFGFQLGATPSSFPAGCQNSATDLNFFGTSAAAPHAAGAAALLRQAFPLATPSQVTAAFESTALPAAPSTSAPVETAPNFDSGYGFIQVQNAYTALAPTADATPQRLNFAAINVGTSESSNLTLTNNGGSPLQITSVSATGDYRATLDQACVNTTVGVGGSCIVKVAFNPSSSGTRTGKLTIQSNALSSPTTIDLSGTGNQTGGGATGWLLLVPLAGVAALRRRKPRSGARR